jgi:MATE family multidrug resistance protein
LTASRHTLFHIRRIVSLAWPILIGQLAVIANGVLDTAMTSRFSTTDLAALALGASIYVSVFVGLSGVLQALAPIIAQLFGARRLDAIGAEVKQGIWLAFFLSIVGCTLLLFPQPFLELAQASPELSEKVTMYLRVLSLALPATLGFRIYSSLNQAMTRPKMVMAIQLVALALKIPLNALFIFGGLGIPALGGPGCAIATAITAWMMLATGWAILRTAPLYRDLGLFGTGFARPHWPAQKALLLLGIPMGLSYLIEVTAFTFMAIFITRLGASALAGHQITANFGTVLYMLPLSLASATGTLVAQAIGTGNLDLARRVGRSGITLAGGLSASLGIAVWLLREQIVHAYTPNEAIAAAALPLFFFIAFYQLFDALQVTTAFVLRAYKVAVIPTVIYAFGLWGAGLGGGYVLGLDPFGWAPDAVQGATGFWLGNSASLGLVAVALLWYLSVVQQRAEPARAP